ncbi:MAG: arginine--tRNA ligase [Lentimicrobiaceae bacterium]|jgi:arginyl-tRNA synthetase|nr:arginine--tRNA ligase [Lentimicrobiaceae bacterium]
MLETQLQQIFINSFKNLYNQIPDVQQISFQKTRPEFEGDMTIVVFPFTKLAAKKPEELAQELGTEMMRQSDLIAQFNVVKGFLNLLIADRYWLDFFEQNNAIELFGRDTSKSKETIVVEYSSPNTNKPLHLGHIRNNLLGWSVSEILKANGNKVFRVNLVNDRGIHICKSMLAWQKWGNGETPETSGKKGDHLVGEMYVRFDKEYKKEIEAAIATGINADEAAKNAPLMREAQEMLRAWEAGDTEVRALWEKMNSWVYDGFDVTYKQLGVDFDKIYYESQTFLLGKQLVEEGLKKGVFYQKEDRSVWCDLTDEGLDEKLLLRADGTSVYMTQDLGTAQLRAEEFNPDKLIYVVGNEQNYHFDVLKRILRKLGYSWAEAIEHLSYGMVELPHGKMKSREGTVVDADDLMNEMIETARSMSEALGKTQHLNKNEALKLYQMIGLGALKYFMLKVDPKKTMLFNPVESIDFNGNTGPFVQYTHARIRSILRKASESAIDWISQPVPTTNLSSKEKSLIVNLHTWPKALETAAENRSPAMVANYIYDLAKEYNQFYQEYSILKEEDSNLRNFRLKLSNMTANMLRNAASLLGITMPERM